MSVRIAIDARWIFAEISGIGAYTRELLTHLAAADRSHAYVLYFHDPLLRDRTVAEAGLQAAPNFTPRLIPWDVFSPAGQLSLPGVLVADRVDVFHSPNYMIPFLAFPRRRSGNRRPRCVVTLHDVIPLKFPEHAPRSKKTRLFPLYRRLMREVGVRADRIIAVSQASRADAIRYLGIPPPASGKVVAVYNGVSDRFRPPFRKPPKPDAEPRTVLYVGRADPYKNLETLVRAFAAARRRCAPPMRLTLAGSADPRYPEPMQLADALGLRGFVRWTGYLPDAELATLYQRADVLVHPSRYEGFGLQILEAMAAGLPVICSHAGALPEVAGDAAILVDPDDVEGFARGIVRVLLDPQAAAELAAKGLAQARRFSWSRTAAETLKIYEELAP
jgi:glycosyltransferase involved in cell wall biosynthesis